MAKLLDSLVHDQLHWQCKHIVGETQFGFSKGKSTTENRVLYESDLLESLERGYQVDSVYTDFSKAFDRVVFKLLFAKLEALGFSLQVRRWFESFLVGRTQSVKINSYISRSLVVTSRVAQGSHCAPLLFNLFVSDIVDVVNHSKVLMFADDLKLYRRVVQWEDTLLLQRDLNALYEWTQVNHLLLNVNKCAFISFYKINERVDSNYQIDHVNLVRVKVVKDLGVWFDEKLNFVEHVSRISISGTRMLGFIIRHSSSFSLGTMRVLYCTLVRSTVEYSTTVWSPLYAVHSSVIERIQNKFLRYTECNMKIDMIDYHRSAMLKLLNLSTLHDRHLLSKINFNIPIRHLQTYELFHVPYHATNYGMHSPIDRTLRFLNVHQDNFDIFGCTLSGFKLNMKHIVNL